MFFYLQMLLQISIDPNKTQYTLIYNEYKTIPLIYQVYAGENTQILAHLYDQSNKMLTCTDIDLNKTLNKEFNFSINYTQVMHLPKPIIGNITCDNDTVHIPITLYSNFSDIKLVLNILSANSNQITIQSSTEQITFDIQPGSISTLLSGPLRSEYKINMADPLAINFLILDQYGNVKNSLCCSQCFQHNVSEHNIVIEPLYSKQNNNQICQIFYAVKQNAFKQKVNISFTFNSKLLQGLANNQPWFYEVFNDSYILSSRVQVSIQNGTNKELLCDLIIGIILIIASIVLFFVIFEKRRKALLEFDKQQKDKIKKMLFQTNVTENTQVNTMNTVDSSQINSQLTLQNMKKRNIDDYERTLDQTEIIQSTILDGTK